MGNIYRIRKPVKGKLGMKDCFKAVQIMVVVCGKVGGQLMQIAFRNTMGDLENLLPDRGMCLYFTPARRRASPRTDKFVRLFPVRFHVAIITRASGRGNGTYPL